MDPKKLPLLRFHNKDFTVVTNPEGEKQAFYRQAPHAKSSPREGKWAPLIGVTFSSHTPVPIVAECREYWKNMEDSSIRPGMGNKEIQRMAEQLDQANLPKPAEITRDPLSVNAFIDTEGSHDLNEGLVERDNYYRETNQTPLQDRVQRGINSLETPDEDKAPKKPNPWGKELLDDMLALNIRLGIQRASGIKARMVPKKIVIALLVINPILHLGTLQAKDLNDYSAKEKVTMAYERLQSLNGDQLKKLLLQIPEKQRVELVEYLPDGVLPNIPLVSRATLAKNVKMAPPDKLKAGIAKVTPSEFAKTSAAISDDTKNQLMTLLSAISESPKKSAQKDGPEPG